MPPSLSGLRVGSSVVHVVALLTTVYRLVHRYRIRRFSWDDAWAFLAFLLDIVELACLWLKVRNDREIPAGTPEYIRSQTIVFWSISFSFTLIVCCARISLWASIRRILAPGRLRDWCIPMAILTGIIALSLITIKAVMCKAAPTSPEQEYPIFCSSPKPLATVQTIADVGLSIFLVGMPLYALYYMDLTAAKRNLMMFLFTASLLTLVAALVHNVYVMQRNRVLNHYTTHIEAAIALFVCNVHIVVASLYTLHQHATSNNSATSESDTHCDSTSRAISGLPYTVSDTTGYSTNLGHVRYTASTLTFTDISSSIRDVDSRRPGPNSIVTHLGDTGSPSSGTGSVPEPKQSTISKSDSLGAPT